MTRSPKRSRPSTRGYTNVAGSSAIGCIGDCALRRVGKLVSQGNCGIAALAEIHAERSRRQLEVRETPPVITGEPANFEANGAFRDYSHQKKLCYPETSKKVAEHLPNPAPRSDSTPLGDAPDSGITALVCDMFLSEAHPISELTSEAPFLGIPGSREFWGIPTVSDSLPALSRLARLLCAQ